MPGGAYRGRACIPDAMGLLGVGKTAHIQGSLVGWLTALGTRVAVGSKNARSNSWPVIG